jgi:hypothetical protein
MGGAASVVVPGAIMLETWIFPLFNDEPDEYNNTINELREIARQAEDAKNQVQNDLNQAKFHLEKGIQHEVLPTDGEF